MLVWAQVRDAQIQLHGQAAQTRQVSEVQGHCYRGIIRNRGCEMMGVPYLYNDPREMKEEEEELGIKWRT